MMIKNFTGLLIGCSLVLTGAALAQQGPQEEQSPTKGKRPEKTQHERETRPERSARPQQSPQTPRGQHGMQRERGNMEKTPKTEQTPGAQHGMKHERGNMENTPKNEQTPGGEHGMRHERGQMENAPNAQGGPETKGKNESETSGTQPGRQFNERNRGMNRASGSEKTPTTPGSTPAVGPENTGNTGAAGATTNTTNVNERNRQMNVGGGKKQKPAPEQVQQIKAEHKDFHAQVNREKAPAVTFNANYRIQGSDRWQGPQYEVFRAYHPVRHDRGWYRSHFTRVELIGGGYYYWNNGYWYPAWGYDPAAEYYAYDGPIYVGRSAVPPDQVIADVQSELQQMGYYQGEVDGLLGPLTREALTAYQTDQGLEPTAAIDEPTLDSLGMNS